MRPSFGKAIPERFSKASRRVSGRIWDSSFGSYNRAKGQAITGRCLRLGRAFLSFAIRTNDLGIELSAFRG